MSDATVDRSQGQVDAATVIGSYRDFLEKFDGFIADLHRRYARHVNCRAGCAKCCIEGVQVTAVEAAEIALAVRELDDQTRAVVQQNVEAPSTGRCPALHLNMCTIYERRPVMCRMFGLPLVDDDPPLTLCDLNFNSFFETGEDEALPSIALPAIRARLRIFNEALVGGEPPPTRSVREALAEALAQQSDPHRANHD
jgi:hypothetical protein